MRPFEVRPPFRSWELGSEPAWVSLMSDHVFLLATKIQPFSGRGPNHVPARNGLSVPPASQSPPQQPEVREGELSVRTALGTKTIMQIWERVARPRDGLPLTVTPGSTVKSDGNAEKAIAPVTTLKVSPPRSAWCPRLRHLSG